MKKRRIAFHSTIGTLLYFFLGYLAISNIIIALVVSLIVWVILFTVLYLFELSKNDYSANSIKTHTQKC